ncbi:hypothetical protein LTS08_000884 [Lithohypha guttulata]|uniref:uncharacterized protein n=1 Tax=Lithohypha guttulata TaxID=1690604 RepID=UPI002DE14536|nr:hypothetical protein LTR51_006501 [Lithohypha guttulata]KAK5106762.1 hypothetical protein LTS08_000884 [Lithohypha guttulata]
MWTSLDAGIDFANPSGIRQQLEKKDRDRKDNTKSTFSTSRTGAYNDVSKARGASGLSKEYNHSAEPADQADQQGQPDPPKPLDHQSRFNALKSFYREQLIASDTNQTSALDAAFSSPSSLTRLMNLYSSSGGMLKKQKPKISVMREALVISEGLQIATDPSLRDDSVFAYDDTPSPEQTAYQYPAPLGNPTAVKVSELKPMPTLLRTKRSKRCAACKHILVKPELKVTSTRYRIKLVALNYIPFITLKPVPTPGGLLSAGPDGDPTVKLQPGKPSQWILTLKNPLFENVDVSLGSPSTTPGKHGHKVTILCPQFSIGKNGDVWDDPISQTLPKSDAQMSLGLGGEQIAGKVYDRGRNWTSVVIEIVASSIVKDKDEPNIQDDDLLQIPVRVNLEWKVTDEQALRQEHGDKRGTEIEGDDGSRSLSYWVVLGIGRVAGHTV